MQQQLLFISLISLSLLGAGCTTATSRQAQPPVKPAVSYQKYNFTCFPTKNAAKNTVATVTPLLAKEGWTDLDRICEVYDRTLTNRVIVIATDLNKENIDNAAIIAVDRAQKKIQVLRKVPTGEFAGASVILDVNEWTPLTVTYTEEGGAAGDGGCVDTIVRDEVAYRTQQISFADQSLQTLNTCRYLSCGMLECTK